MSGPRNRPAAGPIVALALSGCALPPMTPTLPVRTAVAPHDAFTAVVAPPAPDPGVRAVLLPGRAQTAASVRTQGPTRLRTGDVALDFPAVDVQAVAKAVLQDILGLSYSLAPDLHTPITVAPGRRIARSEVLPVFEAALSAAGLALVHQPGGYAILPVEQARAAAPLGAPDGSGVGVGFASEALRLQFVDAEALRRLIDPVLPGVVTGADRAANVLTIAGAPGQRAAARELVRQFDVDWLRGASFALFVPHRTDSRLIVPELEKVLDADGAPTRDRIRLIAMDRLNGILAVSTQPQYLEDVRRWVEILDREGDAATRRLFVYHVQNGRADDLARVLAAAFGQTTGGRGGAGETRRGVTGALPSDAAGYGGAGAMIAGASPPGSSAAAVPGGQAFGDQGANGQGPSGQGPSGQGPSRQGLGGQAFGGPGQGFGGEPSAGPVSVEVQADDFHAKITSDEINNAVVVYATPRDYAVVEDALRKLDVAPYQVVIEAAITEVTLTDALRFGVQGLYGNRGASVGLTESAASATPISEFPGFSAVYAAKTISAALNALEGLTKIKVVSAPKLMVLNNQTASIEVGAQVPILTGTATNVVTSSAAVVNSVDYRDTGIILKVTPRVNSSGLVLLDIAQEVSDVIAAGSSSTIDSPTISTRRIATSVAVQDGEIVALGGLIRDSREDVSSGLPLLSRIPVLGPLLFGNIDDNDTRTELVVLLRPTVIRTPSDARAVTRELLEKLQGLRALLAPGQIP